MTLHRCPVVMLRISMPLPTSPAMRMTECAASVPGLYMRKERVSRVGAAGIMAAGNSPV